MNTPKQRPPAPGRQHFQFIVPRGTERLGHAALPHRDVLHANPNDLPRPKENVGCPGCSCAGPLPGVALQRLWRGSALACAIVIILPLTWRKKPGCIQWEMQPSRCCCGRCSCLGSVYCCELVLPRSSLHGPTDPPPRSDNPAFPGVAGGGCRDWWGPS
jgi:hypothetical protein